MERNNAVVNTPSGKLQGSFEKSCLGDNYYAFKGIPYAKPPIGTTTLGAMDGHSQRDDIFTVRFQPNTTSIRSKLSVPKIDDYYGPDYLMAKDVVLVTINFRLGIFGFLNLRDKVASGNQGLKDQVMALKWVKSHIINFGGDPDNVTIFGESAGAADVHYMTMSPMAKGLFHKAICQSCTALSPFRINKLPNEADMFEFLQRLDCHEKDPVAIVESLRKISFQSLIELQTRLDNTPQKTLLVTRLFLPTVDNKSEEPYMPLSVTEAAKEGIQVPLMIGCTDMEGLTFLEDWTFDLKDIDHHLENYTSAMLDDMMRANNLTLKDLRYLYFKNEAITEVNLLNLLKYWGDLYYVENVHRLVKIQTHCSSAPTYLYKFSYDKNHSLYKMKANITFKGADHGDEMWYLFRSKLYDPMNLEQLQEGTGADRIMRQMVEVWMNFPKTGRPTLEKSDLLSLYWLPVTNDTVLRYLRRN